MRIQSRFLGIILLMKKNKALQLIFRTGSWAASPSHLSKHTDKMFGF